SRPYGDTGPRTRQDLQEKPEYDFIKFVLNDVQANWDRTLQPETGVPYRHARLVLYRDEFPSACGMAQTAVGPFYCPQDQKVYLDLSFFRDLRDRFRAPGEFAQAYVIAHEVGHHVQTLLGIGERVEARRQRASQVEANALSVRMELQADCLAGVWGYRANEARHILERGDLEAALAAASAIGDDRLQRQAQGRVVPESFTHGSSAERVRWFKRGFDQGELRQCDT